MSVIWVGIALILALSALAAEWAMGIRERRVREALEQPLDRVGKEKKYLYQMLFVTTVLALSLGLALSGAHRQWESPVQGVAVVLDTSTFSSNGDGVRQLSIEKGAVVELIHALPGVALSLYELRGGAVHLVVPPTIDRLYFELLLDGILSSPSTVGDPSISTIQSAVAGRFSGPPPWVVVVRPMTVKAEDGDLDGIATIEIQKNGVLCTVYESELSFKGLTIENVAIRIAARLNRFVMSTAPDSTERVLLVVCTGLALFCFVMWRKANAPLFVLGMALASFSQAFSVADVEANAMMRDAAHVAEAKDFEASQKMVESLLTAVASPQGRQRLLYDRALLSYLQGKDDDVLLWLTMEPPTVPENAVAEAETLRGLVLTRLVAVSTTDSEQHQHKEALRQWLETKPKVPQEVVAIAMIALFSPSVHITDREAVCRTLCWLEENAQGAGDNESGSLLQAAMLLAQEMNSGMEHRLRETWPNELVSLFTTDMTRKQNTISTLRIWYNFADAMTPNEAVSFLLDQASMSAHQELFFPRQSAVASKDLALISSVLTHVLPVLLPQHQKLLRQLLDVPTEDGERGAAVWYARAAVWPAMLNYDAQQLKSIALLLCHEIDSPSSILARKAILTMIAPVCPFSGSSAPDKDPFPELLQKALSAWYLQDPEDTLDTVLNFTDKDPQRWSSRLLALIMPYLQKAQTGGPSLPSVTARGIGNDATALDPVLTGRLWQVAEGSVETPQDIRSDVDHLFLLFSELLPRLNQPTDSILRSLVLIFSVQPLVFGQLHDAQIFQKNPRKRAVYDQLLQEWNASCASVQQRIAEPATFRLPKVKQEVEASIGILKRVQALLSESEALPAVAKSLDVRLSEQGKSFSIRAEDAIRLFQEMDRSDRELYGE
jgi:hypothetical protein